MYNKNKIYYYLSKTGDNPVKNFIDSLEKSQKAKIFRIFQRYERYGLDSIIPHTKSLAGTPLWELRLLGKDNIRIIYLTKTKSSILTLHGFVKKKQKTPQKEIYIALERYETWKRGN